MHKLRLDRSVAFLVVVALWCPGPALGNWLKIDEPPDSNKPGTAADISCWLHTAANMLAGAGYGTGDDVQARADEIFDELNTSSYLQSHG